MARPHFRLVPYRILPGVDWFLIGITLALGVLGILTLWGATSGGDGPGPLRGFALKQLTYFSIGLAVMVGLIVFDYRWIKRFTWVFYAASLLLLAGVLIKGATINGARSWYELGPINFQPAELAKLALVIALAHYLSRRALTFRGLSHTFIPLGIVALPLALVLAQPDLGTAAVLVPTTAAMFWVAGIRKWVIVLFFVLGVGVAAAGYPHLKPYQKDRIMVFLDPSADPRGKGYNIIQAQTALGSGELFGKGWGKGTQTNFHFLPEFHTDFIFPTVGEQFGLVGALVVLGLQLVLVGRMLHLAGVVHDLFGVLIVTGLAAILATHIILNVGMTVGMLPCTGLPLPFFSYGGTFLLTCMISIGLTLGIGARRGL